MYRVGYPFWRRIVRAGFPVSFRVNVSFDSEAKVFIATSPEVKGLVVEASSLDELVRETRLAVDMLMEDCLGSTEQHPEAYFHIERDGAFA